MSDADHDKPEFKITIALDETPSSLAAFDAALRLARDLSAQVHAIFVEDRDFFAAAGLPGSRFLSSTGGHFMPFDVSALERAMRLKAARIKTRIAQIAERTGVAYEFETRRGSVRQELLREAHGCTLFAVGASSEDKATGRLGSVARAIAAEAHCAVLFSRARATARRPVIAITERETAAYTMASALARLTGVRLTHWPSEFLSGEKVRAGGIQADLIDRILGEMPSYVVIERAILKAAELDVGSVAERLRSVNVIVTGNETGGRRP